jgi:hypothetical protein
MGRYQSSVSPTKEALAYPHALGDGFKLVEQADGGPGAWVRAGSPNGCPTDNPVDGR